MTTDYSQEAVRRVPRKRGGPRFASYAGFVSRTVAMVVDLLILGAIWVTGGIAADFIMRTSGLSQIITLLEGAVGWITPLQQVVLSAGFSLVVLLALGLFYFTFFYTFGGATPGKYLMGLRVVRSDGHALSGAQAALRTVAYAASSLPVYAGFLNVLLDDRRRAYHDLLTRTAVVHTWRARPDETFLRKAIEQVDRRSS
ncbi:MAG TPA: RDD family protein [Chloroflexaceae bacterium]|nr:RDD family protein [Chloroflexaceae bacterium]